MVIDLFWRLLPSVHQPTPPRCPPPPSPTSPRHAGSARHGRPGAQQRPGVNARRCRRCCWWWLSSVPPPTRPAAWGENARFAFVLPAEGLALRRPARPADRAGRRRVPPPAHHRGDAPPAHHRRAVRRRAGQFSDGDAVALMGPDLPPVKLAINELVRAGVHVVTLFSDVAGLDARNLHRRRQPRRRPHRRLLLGRMAAPGATLLLASPGHAAVGRDRAAHRLRGGRGGALPAPEGAAHVRPAAGDAGATRAAALPARQRRRRGAWRASTTWALAAPASARHREPGAHRQRAGDRARPDRTSTAACWPPAARGLRAAPDIHYVSRPPRVCCARCARTSAGHSTWCSRASRS